MLQANRDCEKCAGDCPKGNYQRPLKKMCGQGVEGRGCGVQHHLHELFCSKAKCFLAAICLSGKLDLAVYGGKSNPWGRRKGQVLHQCMYIPALKSKDNYEVVLWDTGSDTNYVRQEHAENQGFPYRMETVI